MMLELKCPKCNHHMRYRARNGILTGKYKKCVYCGKNYSVRNNIVKKIN